MAKTQVENAGRGPRPMRHLPIGMQYLCSLAWRPAASALSFQGVLLGTTETLILTCAKRRHENPQETVDVLAKACGCGDAADWGAASINWWDHN